MGSVSSDRPAGSDDLLVDIIETLEAWGLADDAYQLHDYIDAEALQQLLASADGDIVVQFTVEGIQLHVSPDEVDVLVGEPPEPGDE